MTDLFLLVFVQQTQKQSVASGIAGQGHTAVMVRGQFAAGKDKGEKKSKFYLLSFKCT